MSDQLALFTTYPTQAGYGFSFPPLSKPTDPPTSHLAARRARTRSVPQRVLLLRQYELHGPMTAWEAGQASGLASRPGCAYWRRVGELLLDNYLSDTGDSRRMPTGEMQRVCGITDAGRALLRQLGH